MSQNHYQVLGVPGTAPAADIKRAYRRLAAALHPDKHGGDPHYEERFKAVAVAYGVLGDPGRRAQYDFALAQAARRAAEVARAATAPPVPAGAPGSNRSPYGAPTPGPGAAPPLRTRPPASRRERHYAPRPPRQQARFNRQDGWLTVGLLALLALFIVAVKVGVDRASATSLTDEARRLLARPGAGGPAGWEQALTKLDEALGYRPDYAPALRLRGELSQDSLGRWADARADYETLLARDPTDPALPPPARAAVLARLGSCLARLRQPAAAERAFSQALTLDSTLTAAHLARGETRLRDLGQTAPGLADLQRARRLLSRAGRPLPLPYLQAEGAALAELARYPEARAVYAEALTREPANGRTLYLRGRLAQQQGDSAGACEWFRRGAAAGYDYAKAAAARCR